MKHLSAALVLAIVSLLSLPARAACPAGSAITATVSSVAGIASYTATVTGTVTRVAYFIDGVQRGGTNTPPFSTTSGSFPVVGPGAHTFFARATCNDISGDTFVSTTQSFTTQDNLVCAGGDFGCAVSSGAVACWGDNSLGQLGNASNVDSHRPVGVTGSAGARSVTCGYESACALFTTGAVKCWGYNGDGNLREQLDRRQ